MYVRKVNPSHRQGGALSTPVRRAGHKRNSQILMGREGLCPENKRNRVLVGGMRWRRMGTHRTDLLEWLYIL